ncbi:hypothetical protein EsH8_V_000719 [Colletotrichum jinshuiense]
MDSPFAGRGVGESAHQFYRQMQSETTTVAPSALRQKFRTESFSGGCDGILTAIPTTPPAKHRMPNHDVLHHEISLEVEGATLCGAASVNSGTAGSSSSVKLETFSSEPQHGDNASAAAESNNNPYRDPKEIPKRQPPTFVYPHSGDIIPLAFHDRFCEVVDIFKHNTEVHAQLREYVHFIDYTLKLCGRSPMDSRPSIVIFCRQSEFKHLKPLLESKPLRHQYSHRRSNQQYPWSKWLNSQKAVVEESHRPLFDLYFWRTRRPRELLWGIQSRASIDRFPASTITNNLTMCGSVLRPLVYDYRCSTLGYVVQVGLDFYGVTASHTFRDVRNEEGNLEPSETSQSYDTLMRPKKDTPLISISESSKGIDILSEKRMDDLNTGIFEDDVENFTDDGEYFTDDGEYFTDDGEYLTDDGEFESFSNDNCIADDSIDYNNNQVIAKGKEVSSSNVDKGQEATILFPKLSEHDLLNELDLDWALVKLENPSHWRPNVCIDHNQTKVIFMTKNIVGFPGVETPVLVITALGLSISGILHATPTLLGGINGKAPSLVRSISLSESKSLRRGDSGSMVVNALTYDIYGHVVASNPLGEVYVSLFKGLLSQVQARFPHTSISLPRPQATLQNLISFHSRHGHVDIVSSLTEHLELQSLTEEYPQPADMAGSIDDFNTLPVLSLDKQGETLVIPTTVKPLPTISTSEMGADVDSKDELDCRPLLFAAEKGRKAVVRLLLENGADIESKDGLGRTPLLVAAEGGHRAVIQLLLEKGADIESKDELRWKPLLVAAIGGHETVVRLLLEKGADIESKDGLGRTPLLVAAEGGHRAIIQLLLEKGADAKLKDKWGRTPLLVSAKEGHEDVVRLLLEKGAEIESDELGQTPLLVAAKGGHGTVMQLLLEKDDNVEPKDRWGRTPLLVAAEGGYMAVIQLLLERGANIKLEDELGRTPLLVAAEEGHGAVIQLLLEKGAEGGQEAVMKQLLKVDDDVKSKYRWGQILLSLAAEVGRVRDPGLKHQDQLDSSVHADT